MQKIVASILIIAILGQSFDQGWYYLGYLIEKKAYMERCENKALPQLHCNGKCQLMKKIEEQRQKEQGEAPELKVAAKSILIAPVSFNSLSNPADEIFLSYNVSLTIGEPVARSRSFFHPPSC